jgi:hypothetical protein
LPIVGSVVASASYHTRHPYGMVLPPCCCVRVPIRVRACLCRCVYGCVRTDALCVVCIHVAKYVGLCMYAYMHVCVCKHVWLPVSVCTYACLHACTHPPLMYLHLHPPTHMCLRVRLPYRPIEALLGVCVCVCVCVCLCRGPCPSKPPVTVTVEPTAWLWYRSRGHESSFGGLA